MQRNKHHRHLKNHCRIRRDEIVKPQIQIFTAYTFLYGENFIGDSILSNRKAFKSLTNKKMDNTNKLLIRSEILDFNMR